MTRRDPDVVGAAAIAVVGLATLGGGLATVDPGFGVVPPAALPVALGVLMLASAAWLAFDTSRRTERPAVEALDRRPFAATAIASALFLAAFVPLGFVLSGAAFLVAQSRIVGSRALVRDAIAAVVFVLAVYWLFVGFLTVDLPNGPLPF
ncbi:MAG TPA: tripartite tricarboxylate transporter TctB family protein [Candidatus Limnocylindria bacterium]|nr:tripartite tricarboxylate transporter TctB family protein [Candidatus Limnocylindria bacterium]